MSYSYYIRRCLDLAEDGRGHVGVNPMVGAVLVRNGAVVAEGYHKAFGKLHAERELLQSFSDVKGQDVLYVNLEPCCHDAKTPPCTDIIIKSGIQTVVFGMYDPNPVVSGKGAASLRQAGIRVIGPVQSEFCRRFNRGFVSLCENGRPWITLKMAIAANGAIANADGSPMKITNPEQDCWSHTNLRSMHDAILVGVQTVNSDNPLLDTRLSNKKIIQNFPFKIVLDPYLRLSNSSEILKDASLESVMIITSEHSDVVQRDALQKRGVRIELVKYENNMFSFHHLWQRLTAPSEQFVGISSILVEGGQKTWSHFIRNHMVDEQVILTH